MTGGKMLIIAGGGTGGHIFPGIAVAEEWRRRGGKALFVGTPAGQEGKLVPQYGFDLKMLKVGRLKGGSFFTKLKTLLSLPVSIVRSLMIIKRAKPSVVLGIGGYASGPASIAAWLMHKPLAVMDQNVQPGITNRMLGKLAKRVFVSFIESEKFFGKGKIFLSGNPIRSRIAPVVYEAPQTKICLFIFGGSQGALTLNENVLLAIDELKAFWSRFEIYHQATTGDLAKVEEFYKERNILATVKSFFDDMSALYAKAHLVICRSGAGTLTELALCGRPAILVPYPFAADDHQKKNALVFVRAGAALVFDQKELSGKILAEAILKLVTQPDELCKMAEKMRSLAKPQAAQMITDELEKLAA